MNQPETQSFTSEAHNNEPYTNLQVGPAQIERLAQLGVLTQAELEAGRKAGGMTVRVPGRLIAEFEQQPHPLAATHSADLTYSTSLLQSSGTLELEHLTRETSEAADEAAEIERLAQRINQSGMNGVARLFIASNRPMSFFASQLLLLVQPVSRFTLGIKDPTGRYSRLLENRANLDALLNRLDELETARRRARHSAKKERP